MDAACAMATHKVPIKVVLQRPGKVQADMDYNKGDRDYHVEMKRVRQEGRAFEACVEVDSEDPLYT